MEVYVSHQEVLSPSLSSLSIVLKGTNKDMDNLLLFACVYTLLNYTYQKTLTYTKQMPHQVDTMEDKVYIFSYFSRQLLKKKSIERTLDLYVRYSNIEIDCGCHVASFLLM